MRITDTSNKIIQYIFVVLIVLFLLACYKFFDVKLLSNLIDKSQDNLLNNTWTLALIIYYLRFLSIVIPILPGTYCSIISGYLFGIEGGLLIIFAADFMSCSSSFLIARKLGRNFVKKLLGYKQMLRIEKISQSYIENNFFLMTGLLMTQFFDFVCYAVGLTKVTWKKFMPALIVSIIISDAPFVAGGYSIKRMQDASIREILNGNIQVLQGPYLLLFIVSVLSIFLLALLSSLIQKRRDLS